jgi:hypothetical protein
VTRLPQYSEQAVCGVLAKTYKVYFSAIQTFSPTNIALLMLQLYNVSLLTKSKT